jgi:hypothetical protein
MQPINALAVAQNIILNQRTFTLKQSQGQSEEWVQKKNKLLKIGQVALAKDSESSSE